MEKIFFFTSSMSFGGKERQTFEMIKYLSNIYNISLYILNKKQHSYTDTYSLPNSSVHQLCPSGRSILKRLKCYFTVIKAGKPDIIHTMDAISTYFCFFPARMFRIPIINGCIRHAGVTSGFEYYFEKISLWLSNYIVANSHAGLKHYGLEKSKKASVVYNFIDASRFKESECRSPILVMTANFTLYKDHRTMLFCAERLILENKIQKLNLIGGGPGLQKWQKWVTDKQLQNKIFFYGKISNVEELLSECSIGILCSTSKYKEGISNSILEYMGSGLLAIASDIGGTSEIIEDGKNGLLFEVENQDSLYRCITWALSNQNESKVVSQNGTDTVKSKFSVQTNSELLLKVYNKFI